MFRIQSLILMMLSLAFLGLVGCKGQGAAEGSSAGQVAFSACVACHKADGSGNEELGAPRIAGLQAWYVKEQLSKFRDGRRGAHPDDAPGLRMRPMSRALSGDAEVDAVSDYVASLPKAKPSATLTGGDAAKGAATYAICTACHGPDGAGNEALGSPSLTAANDWYLQTQLNNFKSGLRGATVGDLRGAQMAPMAMTLADDQAILDVLAHIHTLGN
jgi:cytochrome c oxidase subunit 2